MRKLRGIIIALIMLSFCCVNVYAIEMQSSDENTPDNVVGQVTITNVDSADNSIRLNGAHIKITDKDTNKEYTDVINEDGTLVYELPLGNYNVKQVRAPEDYKINTRLYEFTLQIPSGTNASNIKVVSASILMTNDYSGDETESEIGTDKILAGGIDLSSEPEPSNSEPAETNERVPMSPAEKNPVTSDTTFIILAIIVLLITILFGCIISLKHIKRRL